MFQDLDFWVLVFFSLHISPSTVILTFFLWLVIVSQDLPQWTSLSLCVDKRAPMQPVCACFVRLTCNCSNRTDTISASEHSFVMLIHDHGMKLSGYHLHSSHTRLIIMQMLILGELGFSTKFEQLLNQVLKAVANFN